MDQTQTGNLQTALAQAAKLLGARPALAEEQANEILKVVPGNAEAVLLLARARRLQGNGKGAREVLERLTRIHPNFPEAYYELGEILTAMGETRLADDAYARAIRASVHNPRLIEAANALCENNLAVAERILREFLKTHPTDVAAIRMLAEVGARLRHYDDAEALLARALELAPSFMPARHNYAALLFRQNKADRALAEVDELLKGDPLNPSYRILRAACFSQINEYAKAERAYEDALKDFPDQPKSWMSLGHVRKTLGKQSEGIDAYRRAIALLPSLGEVYWSLANLKTFRFTAEEIAAMRHQLTCADLADEDRLHFEFALGKALEDQGAFEESFAHYKSGNALRRKTVHYDAENAATFMARLKRAFTREFFAMHEGTGCPAPDPIFVVGLPRSGSTLVEQILASHSRVEGTMELHDITVLSRSLGSWSLGDGEPAYPEVLAALPPERFRALGEDYLSRTQLRRKLGRALFVDKMPNNFMQIGFIHLILPNAKIIDARRQPMGCCFSNYKQHFAHGQAFSYDLESLGRYYRDYVELMAHFDAVLPGRVHRVFHENMVEDPEREIRALLAYCGLPFEEACLNFHETDRAVRTASSEQVRRPIFSEGVEQWRNYEPWLGPLKDALGAVLEKYPDVPHPPLEGRLR
jgi:tetratricopeptide (TPR) repeat protein